MSITNLLELTKPAGTDSFTRTAFNNNMDIIDLFGFIGYCFLGIPWPDCSKGAVVKNAENKPESQTVSGPNGLTGSMTWSFTATTIAETLSITAPITSSITKTTTRADLSEVCE